jgi:sulfur-oxidizing protein SoxX
MWRGLALMLFAAAAAQAQPLVGDAQRGRALIADRTRGLCLLCHSAPIPEERFQGDLAPSLAGAGARWSAEQLRARLRDGVPGSIMPAYGPPRAELQRVGRAWQGKPVLEAQQIEDVVAYLQTLQ